MIEISYEQLERTIKAGVEGYLENEWNNIVDTITENIMTALAMGSEEEYRIMPDE